jgi:hypothetical protein
MQLRRPAALAVAAVALSSAWLPARAAAPTTASRTVSVAYSQPGGVTPLAPGGTSLLVSPGPTQQVGATEDHLRVVSHDSGGSPVAVSVEYQPSATSGTVTTLVCGDSGLLRVQHGTQVRATPVAGTCADGRLSLPTSGSLALTFVRPLPKPTPASSLIPADRRWAVVIGITRYAGSTHPTYGGTGDADAVLASLLAAGWRSDHIQVLKDSAASGQAVLDAMSWLAARSGPKTYSLLHFSGHACIASRGPCGSGHTYLWSADNRFIPETTVASVLGRVQGRAWFDFAACESGAFDAGLHSPLRLVTASAQAHETAYEVPDWHESVWTGFVFDQGFLKGGAGPAPRRATIAQLVEFGRTRSTAYTSGQQAGAQHPYAAGGESNQSLFAPHS